MGIATVFLKDQYLAHYDSTHTFSVLQAIDHLATYVSAERLFNGVMGFLQGAALAGILLARRSPAEPSHFVILLCAGLRFYGARLWHGELRYLDPNVDKEVIRVPTAHIVGSKDDALQASLAMMELCVTEGRGLFEHKAGHEVPVSPKEITGDMARCAE